MVNLLENALKFARKDEWTRITVGCNMVTDEMVYFVKDNGIGFDMKESADLFIPFHRLHKQTDFGGVGLGLSLVKRVIERHGGRIWCESEIDKGTTFYFTLGEVRGRIARGQKKGIQEYDNDEEQHFGRGRRSAVIG